MKRKNMMRILSLAAAFMLAGCGGGNSKDNTQDHNPADTGNRFSEWM